MRGRWQSRKWIRCRRLFALAVPLWIAGCTQTTTFTGGTDAACLIFQPVTYSTADTPETVRQILGHNAAWGSLCK